MSPPTLSSHLAATQAVYPHLTPSLSTYTAPTGREETMFFLNGTIPITYQGLL